MVCLLYCPEKRYLMTLIMSDNPNKKIRLDFQKKSDGCTGNEDLWGQDDLTAEEFDMLEIQATQSCNQNYNNCDQLNSFIQVNDSKQHQYELEGRVKLLSQSLGKSLKELSEERLNRERIINDQMKEFYERETNLQKEVEKMRSILDFKDQEMKSTYSKLQIMKSQLQDKKNSSTETSLNKNFEDFLKSSNSGPHDNSCNFNAAKKFHRRYKLSIDTPKGKTKGIDILSSILCTRLAIPSFPSSENTINCTHLEDSSSNFTSISVVQLKNEQKSDDLLEHYKCILKNHVVYLKTLAKSNVTNCSKSSPLIIKRKEAGAYIVKSLLCDIAYLLTCAKFEHLKECTDQIQNSPTSNLGNEQIKVTRYLSLEHLFHNQDSVNLSTTTLSEILEPLLALTDPKTYPNGYPKNEEIEFSLSALLTICLSYPKKCIELGFEPPIHSLLNPHQSITAVCTTLKLLTVLCSFKNVASLLTHKSNNCLLCLIAAFLINVVPYYPEKFSSCVILAEDFFSSIFSIHDIAEIHLETYQCISEVIQGIIKSVWKYFQLKEKCNLRIQIIKKGFLLLHTMSNSIPNFKERRNSMEDEYISLITSILAVSKENIEFREFYDLIHSLWDFQTDTTELDLDELPEETQASANETDIVL